MIFPPAGHLGSRVFVVATILAAPLLARAQTPPTESPATPPTPNDEAPKGPNVTMAGYVEAFFQWNFNKPSNGITNYRGFDTHHDSFTLANAVLDASWKADRVRGRFALQIGHTGQTYYLSEPNVPGSGGSGSSNADLWKFIQQANVGYDAPIGRGLLVEAGIFLSPIGPEGLAIKDQWNWSRSNLFFGLPFYHTGARATYSLSDAASVSAAVWNGWNSVVDNNRYKSMSASFNYVIPDKVNSQILYFGGVERPIGAPEGNAWRHLFDGYVSVRVHERVELMAHGDAGFEKNTFGTSWWAAGALYARVKMASWLYVAARADRFREHAATNDAGSATALFWPSAWVSSGTLTLDTRPSPDNLSVRLEYRHDQADGATYFKGDVSTDASGAFINNARKQDTVTLGAVAWF
jgi:hypothetical protein